MLIICLKEQSYCDAGKYQRLRTLGWAYAHAGAGTIALYCCYDAQAQSHFVSNMENCERRGRNERILGYALAR
jgi:hypothetical protein